MFEDRIERLHRLASDPENEKFLRFVLYEFVKHEHERIVLSPFTPAVSFVNKHNEEVHALTKDPSPMHILGMQVRSKRLANLNIARVNVTQKGTLDLTIDEQILHLMVSTQPTEDGEIVCVDRCAMQI